MLIRALPWFAHSEQARRIRTGGLLGCDFFKTGERRPPFRNQPLTFLPRAHARRLVPLHEDLAVGETEGLDRLARDWAGIRNGRWNKDFFDDQVLKQESLV